jgi:hypothetical protein
MGIPTRPNKTSMATASDFVLTNPETAKWIVQYFNDYTGILLDPCAGEDAFYKNFPKGMGMRCEIKDGIDFFGWDNNNKVKWIITNPPYSIYDLFLEKSFAVSDNVVFFVPIAKAFKSNKVQKMVSEYGGLKEIIYMGSGSKHGFSFGFPVGCLHYQKNYKGKCKISSHI